MFFTTACYLHTPHPEKTASFLQNILGFEIITKKPIFALSNGTLELRLVRGEQPAILEIQCSDMKKDSAELLRHPEVHKRTEIARHHCFLEQHLYCDCGVTLILIKPLSEDDNNELIALPITLVWQENLLFKAQTILRSTPLAFREQARKNIVEHAEYLAIERGDVEVHEQDVMHAFVRITPPFQHQTLYEAMLEQGVDAEAYLDPKAWVNESCSNV